MTTTPADYLARQRHVLLDMHIPDWDERLLSRFDPHTFVNHCINAGADAVMIYCNSHVGLCHWPTESGRMHPGLGGADVVRTQLDLLRENGIAVCAYYSGPIFNNWAYTTHPDWRIAPSSPGGMAGPGSRYGVVCPNNPACLEFSLTQVGELVERYEFDAFFFDMVFWPSVCVCQSCRERYRAEHDAEIPTVIDWFNPDWCRFQAARERWLTDAFGQLRDRVNTHRDIPTYLNGGNVKFSWWSGASYELLRLNDVLGGDFHHRSVLPTLTSLTPSTVQYMKAVSAYGGGASQLLPVEEQLAHAFAATTFDAQFMAIDAVAPDGTVSPSVYDRLREVFAATKRYDDHRGGTPVVDVAVYVSQSSLVDFNDNGLRLDQQRADMDRSPHAVAVEGAVRALQDAHLAVGVATRADLDRLDDFAVVVLPNVLRMNAAEIDAFRAFVSRGGRLYASGYTSLVTTDGTRHPDFQLADVFGAHVEGMDGAAVSYLQPADAEVAAWISPFAVATHGEPSPGLPSFDTPRTALRVRADSSARIRATVTQPYRDGRGTRDDQDWISIHNSPPWEETELPALVHRRFGLGEAMYASMDVEASGGGRDAASKFVVGAVQCLLGPRRRFEVDAPPQVRFTVFDGPEPNRLRLCLLNFPATFPALPVRGIRVRLTPPPASKFTALRRLPAGEPYPFFVDDDGSLRAELDELLVFEMIEAEYEPC